MRRNRIKVPFQVLRYPAQPWSPRALSWPLLDPCRTLVVDPSLAVRLPPPHPGSSLENTTAPHPPTGPHHSPQHPPLPGGCPCCALSHPPVARGRPSAYDRRAPRASPSPSPSPSSSTSPSPSPAFLELRPLWSGCLLSSLARSPPPPPFYLHSNRNPRSTIFVPALAHRSTHWSDRIRESRLPDHQLPESVEALQASRRVGSGQIRLAAPHSAPPSVLSPPCLPVICPPGVDASHLSSASLPIRELCLCSLAVSRPFAPLPAARHDRHALDRSLSPLPSSRPVTPLPPGPRSPPPAPPSLSLKPAKPPRRQFPPFLALALVEF